MIDDGRLGCGMVRYDIYDYFLGSDYRWVGVADSMADSKHKRQRANWCLLWV